MSIQNVYNLVNRVYDTANSEISIHEQCGLLAYSPLAGGRLSGKYLNGQNPPNARYTLWGRRFSRHATERGDRAISQYCQIAEKYGPVTIITLCKNIEQALSEDPKIKEVIVLDQKNKTFFGIFKIVNILKSKNFDKIFIYYPSYRTQFAAKLASISEIFYYPVSEKKNLHLVNKAKFYTEKWLYIKNSYTETKLYIDNEKKLLASKKLKTDHNFLHFQQFFQYLRELKNFSF